MTNFVQAVQEIAAHGGPGRYVCPKCFGGTDREHSLSIRFDEASGVHWRCFRSSCGYTGGPRGTRSVFASPKKEPRHYTRPIVPLSDKQYRLIEDKFGIEPGTIEGYNETDDRFLLGVYGPIGHNFRGYVVYSLSGAKPKTLTYNLKSDEPFIHYAISPRYAPNDIVIVEDWFSAEKVATTDIAAGAAIMGTYLGQDHITELASVAKEWGAKVWLALDKDAYPKTLGYIARYREQFPLGLYAWSLDKDLKYESTGRITEALVDGKVDFTRGRNDRTATFSGNDEGAAGL